VTLINNEPNSEDNVFEELDVPFTEPELERGIRDLKRDKSTEFDNLMNEYVSVRLYFVSLRSTSVCFRWYDYY
jgi:hypothetical protein